MSDTTTVVARGTSTFLAQSFISGAFRILNVMMLARLLLVEQMGQVAILAIIYGIMQFLGALGLNYASPLVVPEAEQGCHLDRVRAFLNRSVVIIGLTSSVLAVLLAFLLPLILSSSLLSQDMQRLVLVIAPLSALSTFLDSFLLARYAVRPLTAGRILFDFVRMALSVGLVLLGFGVMGVLTGWLCGEVAALAIFGFSAVRGCADKPSSIAMRPILAFALPSLLFQTIDVTIQNTDRVILVQLTNLGALGVYDVMLGILFMMSFVSLTVSTSLYPILTRIRIDLETREPGRSGTGMGTVVTILLRYILLILLPVAIVGALNSHTILNILFGTVYSNYPGSSVAFSILVLSYALWGVVYGLHTVLRSMGESRFFLFAGLAIIAFEVAACWKLVSLFGLLGSALTRSVYIMLLFFAALWRIRHRGVNGLRSVIGPGLKIASASFVCGLVLLIVSPLFLLDLLIWLIVVAVLYVALLFAVKGVEDIDFRVARSVFPRQLHGLLDRIQKVYSGKLSEQTHPPGDA